MPTKYGDRPTTIILAWSSVRPGDMGSVLPTVIEEPRYYPGYIIHDVAGTIRVGMISLSTCLSV